MLDLGKIDFECWRAYSGCFGDLTLALEGRQALSNALQISEALRLRELTSNRETVKSERGVVYSHLPSHPLLSQKTTPNIQNLRCSDFYFFSVADEFFYFLV